MLLGAYVMDHLLAAAMGLLKVSGGAGMQLFGLINLMSGFGLLYATYFIPRNPHTWLAVSASLFPITSPIVLLIRVVVSEVPQWQIIVAQILLWLTNLGVLFWLHRLLRANLVAYRGPFRLRVWLGEKLSMRRVFSKK
jgi:ABC-2 type transport system permease protein